MAQLPGSFAFDASQVEPIKPLEPLPTGWYNVKITATEMKPTSKQDGTYLEVEMEVLDGEYAGRKVWDRLNLVNANATAQEIAYRTLSAICRATGVINISDTTQLHGHPLMARVLLRPPGPGADGKVYDASNDVRGYKAIGEAGGAPAGAGAPASSGTPPWTPPATAPAQQKPADGWKAPAGSPPWQKPADAPAAPAQPPAFPPEAYAWAKANPTDPEAVKILATLPHDPTPPASKPWEKPAAPGPTPAAAPQGKPPWVK